MTPVGLVAEELHAPPRAEAAQRCAVCEGARLRQGVYGCLAKCLRCGYLFYPWASSIDPEALYTADYFQGAEYFDYRSQRATLAKNFRRHLALMRRYGAGRGRLFEIGCAYGFFLQEAARQFEVRGVDVSAEAVAFARETLQLPVACGTVDATSREEPYDVVCIWETLEHVVDPARAVQDARGLLKPGGHLFLTVPDVGSLVARLQGRRWRQIHPPTHLNYFSRPTMRLLLERMGFVVKGMRSIGAHREITNMICGVSLFSKRAWVRRAAGAVLRRTGRFWGHRDLYVNLFDMMFVAAQLPAAHDRP